jgi:hypothetical protein
MRALIIAACCAALVGSVTIASTQSSFAQDAPKTDTSTKMKKKSSKKSSMKKTDDTMSKGTDDTKK